MFGAVACGWVAPAMAYLIYASTPTPPTPTPGDGGGWSAIRAAERLKPEQTLEEQWVIIDL